MRYWVTVLSLMLSFVGGAKDLTGKVYDNCTDVSNVKCMELGKVLCKHHNPTQPWEFRKMKKEKGESP